MPPPLPPRGAIFWREFVDAARAGGQWGRERGVFGPAREPRLDESRRSVSSSVSCGLVFLPVSCLAYTSGVTCAVVCVSGMCVCMFCMLASRYVRRHDGSTSQFRAAPPFVSRIGSRSRSRPARRHRGRTREKSGGCVAYTERGGCVRAYKSARVYVCTSV